MKVKVQPGETVLHSGETYTEGDVFECAKKAGEELVRRRVAVEVEAPKPPPTK